MRVIGAEGPAQKEAVSQTRSAGLATEAEIIRVAIPMFAARGYGFVSMREIAFAAGITAPRSTIILPIRSSSTRPYAPSACCAPRTGSLRPLPMRKTQAGTCAPGFAYAPADTMIADRDSTLLFQRELIFADGEMLSLMSDEPFRAVFETITQSLDELTEDTSPFLQTTAIYALTLGMLQYCQLFEAGYPRIFLSIRTPGNWRNLFWQQY